MYTREITYLSREIDAPSQKWADKPVTKKATFKDLDRKDELQKYLHWKILEVHLFGNKTEQDGQATMTRIGTRGLCDLVYEYIDTMLVLNDDFKEADKKEFLQDNGAVLQFGMWVFFEKISSFFLTLISNSTSA